MQQRLPQNVNCGTTSGLLLDGVAGGLKSQPHRLGSWCPFGPACGEPAGPNLFGDRSPVGPRDGIHCPSSISRPQNFSARAARARRGSARSAQQASAEALPRRRGRAHVVRPDRLRVRVARRVRRRRGRRSGHARTSTRRRGRSKSSRSTARRRSTRRKQCLARGSDSFANVEDGRLRLQARARRGRSTARATACARRTSGRSSTRRRATRQRRLMTKHKVHFADGYPRISPPRLPDAEPRGPPRVWGFGRPCGCTR